MISKDEIPLLLEPLKKKCLYNVSLFVHVPWFFLTFKFNPVFKGHRFVRHKAVKDCKFEITCRKIIINERKSIESLKKSEKKC